MMTDHDDKTTLMNSYPQFGLILLKYGMYVHYGHSGTIYKVHINLFPIDFPKIFTILEKCLGLNARTKTSPESRNC